MGTMPRWEAPRQLDSSVRLGASGKTLDKKSLSDDVPPDKALAEFTAKSTAFSVISVPASPFSRGTKKGSTAGKRASKTLGFFLRLRFICPIILYEEVYRYVSLAYSRCAHDTCT
jgi:hypothetical protein